MAGFRRQGYMAGLVLMEVAMFEVGMKTDRTKTTDCLGEVV